MCKTCDKEVIEMGILESDLPNLPFQLMKWRCIVEGCKGATKVRDYGIAPLYYWPVKLIREDKNGQHAWRGGWTNVIHAYMCCRHFPQYKLDEEHFINKYLFQLPGIKTRDQAVKYLMERVVPIEKSKLYKVKPRM